MTDAAGGVVVTDPSGDGYHGADKQTNNTGELTALLHALLTEAERCRMERTTINCDSQYAINTVLGRTVLRKKSKNVALATKARDAYRALIERKGHARVRRVCVSHMFYRIPRM